MNLPRIKIRDRLLTRLLVSHIFLVTVPLFLTGNILTDTAQEAVEQTVLERNLEFARRSTALIESSVEKARDILRLIAQQPVFYSDDRIGKELTINSMVNEFPLFKMIAILDTAGSVFASTAYEDPDRTLVANGSMLELAKGQKHISDVYVSKDLLPLMNLAEPIRLHNEVIGVLWAVVDLTAMWALVDNNVVGEYGEAFIFRADGQYIAHSDRRKVYMRSHFEEQDIIRAVAADSSAHKVYVTRDGVEMIAAYAPMKELNWGAVIQQPTSEAFASARKMRLQILILMIGSSAVAALIAFFYTRQIVKPVELLVSGIDRLAAGDLRQRIQVLGKDEIGRLAERFNTMAARLLEIQNKLKRTERFETLGKLSSVISHEIRNPLNSMVINMQLLRREFSKPRRDLKKMEHYHQVVASEIKRVDGLVSNFLLIAKPPKLEKTDCTLTKLLDEMITVQMPNVLPKGIRVERDYAEPALTAHVDEKKLYQVFLNIFLNAVEAMQGGGRIVLGVRRHIPTVSGEGPDAEAMMAAVSFRDTGKGIPPEDLNRIFDFYYSKKEHGTGIGLSLAQQIVEEHGGFIKVKSRVGAGSEFTILLPLSKTSP
jgi:signal transduction histidine kinase